MVMVEICSTIFLANFQVVESRGGTLFLRSILFLGYVPLITSHRGISASFFARLKNPCIL